MTILSAEGIGFRFNNSAFELKNVSLDLSEGQILGFLGRNGAGKSTVMRILLGIIRPLGGRVVYCAQPLTRAAFTSIGVLIERGAIYPNLTALENLLLHCGLRGLPNSCALDVLAEMRIDYPQKQVKAISMGMRQKLALAIALLGKPKLLVLDEPLSGLDPAVIGESLSVLRNYAAQGGAVLLSSHQLADVQQISTDICVLDGGTIAYRASMAELAASAMLQVKCDDPARAVQLLRAAGVDAALQLPLLSIKRGNARVDIVKILVSAGFFVEEVHVEPLLAKFFASDNSL